MRNMSFSMTTEQVRNRTKTVTRRFGWWSLKPGTKLWAVEKAQGLKKGEKVKRICQIEIVGTWTEQAQDIMYYGPFLSKELRLEGFPDSTSAAFIDMLCKGGHSPCDDVNRIEFKYL